jgi:hypothetical protein
MAPRRVLGMIESLKMMCVSHMRVMCRLFVVAPGVVVRCFIVVVCGLRVMVCRLPVMMRCVL